MQGCLIGIVMFYGNVPFTTENRLAVCENTDGYVKPRVPDKNVSMQLVRQNAFFGQKFADQSVRC
jgi:hypothetical protein